jgi:hypothetical protein
MFARTSSAPHDEHHLPWRIVNLLALLVSSSALTWGLVATLDRWNTFREYESYEPWKDARRLLSVPVGITIVSLLTIRAIWRWRFRTTAFWRKVIGTLACQVITLLIFLMACWYQQIDRIGTNTTANVACFRCSALLPDDDGLFSNQSITWFDSKTGSDWESTTVWGTEAVELHFVSQDTAEATLLRDPSQRATFRRHKGIAPYLRLARIRVEPIRFELL